MRLQILLLILIHADELSVGEDSIRGISLFGGNVFSQNVSFCTSFGIPEARRRNL